MKLESLRGAAREGEIEAAPEAKAEPLPTNGDANLTATWQAIDYIAARCNRSHDQVLKVLSTTFRELSGFEGTKGARDVTELLELLAGALRHVGKKPRINGVKPSFVIIDSLRDESTLEERLETTARAAGMTIEAVVEALTGVGSHVKKTVKTMEDFGKWMGEADLDAPAAPEPHEPRRGRPAKMTPREQRREQVRQSKVNARRRWR